MKQYIGTKRVQAEPAVRIVNEKGNRRVVPLSQHPITCPTDTVDLGYKVVYEDGYESWSPQDVFEKAYRPTDGMSFGLAVEVMRKGARIARWCWAEDVYLFLGTDVGFHTDADISEFADKDVPVCDMIVLRSEDKEFIPGWLPTHPDILADDWHIVE